MLPEAVEPVRIHLGVAGGVGDLPMPETGRKDTGIDTLIHELVAARMPQEMRMDIVQADAVGRPAQHLEKPSAVSGAPRSDTKTLALARRLLAARA